MAIDRTGISSLETGAPEITYTGDQGPKSPDQMLMASADPMLVEQYQQYVFEMEEQGMQPMSFKEFVQQVMSGMAEGGIARLGYAGGQLVKPGPGRPGYQGGRWDDPGMSPGQSRSQGPAGGATMGGGGGEGAAAATIAAAQKQAAQAPSGPGNIHYDPVEQAVAQAAAEKIKRNQAIDASIKAAGDDTVPTGTIPYPRDIHLPGPDIPSTADTPQYQDRILRMRSGQEPGYRAQDERPYGFQDIEEAYRAGAATKDEFDKYIDADPVLTLDRGLDATGGLGGLGDAGTGGGEGGAGTNVLGTPIVPTGLTAAESAQAFEDAKAAEIAKVQAAAASGAPFEHYYVGGDPTAEQEKFMQEQKAAASMVGRESWPAARGGRVPAAFGGIMDSATGRRAYGLGSIGKVLGKAAKAVGKVLKSPVGMMALSGLLGGQAGLFGKGIQDQGWKKFLGSKILGTATRTMHPEGHVVEGDRVGGLLNWAKDNPMLAIAGLSASPFLFQGKEEEGTNLANMDYGPKLDLLGIRKKILDKKGTREEFPYLNPDQYAVAADGGRIGYAYGSADTAGVTSKVSPSRVEQIEGSQMADEAYQKILSAFLKRFPGWDSDTPSMEDMVAMLQLEGTMGTEGAGILDLHEGAKMITPESVRSSMPGVMRRLAQGGRIGYQDGRSVRSIALNQLYGIAPKRKEAQEGGLMDLGGMEKDYREEGGFVPIGGQERADDVPARLSKNEFVFTADAVRSAGGGDIDKGAEVMENVMNNLEQGGQVSEESQGLEGARNMFATAQRLEGVL